MTESSPIPTGASMIKSSFARERISVRPAAPSDGLLDRCVRQWDLAVAGEAASSIERLLAARFNVAIVPCDYRPSAIVFAAHAKGLEYALFTIAGDVANGRFTDVRSTWFYWSTGKSCVGDLTTLEQAVDESISALHAALTAAVRSANR